MRHQGLADWIPDHDALFDVNAVCLGHLVEIVEGVVREYAGFLVDWPKVLELDSDNVAEGHRIGKGNHCRCQYFPLQAKFRHESSQVKFKKHQFEKEHEDTYDRSNEVVG